jgi:hypothetical protein
VINLKGYTGFFSDINLNLNNRVFLFLLKDLDTRLSAFFKLFNKENL